MLACGNHTRRPRPYADWQVSDCHGALRGPRCEDAVQSGIKRRRIEYGRRARNAPVSARTRRECRRQHRVVAPAPRRHGENSGPRRRGRRERLPDRSARHRPTARDSGPEAGKCRALARRRHARSGIQHGKAIPHQKRVRLQISTLETWCSKRTEISRMSSWPRTMAFAMSKSFDLQRTNRRKGRGRPRAQSRRGRHPERRSRRRPCGPAGTGDDDGIEHGPPLGRVSPLSAFRRAEGGEHRPSMTRTGQCARW